MINRKLILMLAVCLLGTQIVAMKRSADMVPVTKAERAFKRTTYNQPRRDNSLHGILNRKRTYRLANQYQYTLWTHIVSGADVNEKDKFGCPFLLNFMTDTSLSEQEKSDFLELLVQHGVDLEARSPFTGTTLLHQFVFDGNKKGVTELLGFGANVNAIDTFGKTPLHYVNVSDENKKNQASDIAKILVNAGVDVNKRDMYGCSPLHYVSFDQELSKLLFLADGDIENPNNYGNTPYDSSKKVDGTKNEDLKNRQTARENIFMPAFNSKVGNLFTHLNDRERGQYNRRPLNNLSLLS